MPKLAEEGGIESVGTRTGGWIGGRDSRNGHLGEREVGVHQALLTRGLTVRKPDVSNNGNSRKAFRLETCVIAVDARENPATYHPVWAQNLLRTMNCSCSLWTKVLDRDEVRGVKNCRVSP